MRSSGRKKEQIRPVKITRNFTKYAEGSVLIEVGDTKVLCTASIEEKVPPFLKGSGEGWITAEYKMLPRSTQSRKQRDINKLKIDGRTMEIQRLIGRALRSAVDMKALGEKTRTTSITGSFVALVDAVNKLHQKKPFNVYPIRHFVSAVSIGIVGEEKVLDLCYEEDHVAKVDMNVVMTEEGEFIEIQGTGEIGPFSRKELDELLNLAEKGAKQMIQAQKDALKTDSLWIGTGRE